jgi:hypothetical protein
MALPVPVKQPLLLNEYPCDNRSFMRVLRPILIVLLLSALAFANHTVRTGRYFITLFSPPQGYFAGEDSEISFRIVDAGKSNAETYAPLIGAQLRCVIDMPSMPSMPKIEQVAEIQGSDGIYIVRANLPHGGDFRLTLSPARQSTTSAIEPFTAEFLLPVNDADSGRAGALTSPFSLELVAIPTQPTALQSAELQLQILRSGQPLHDSSGVALHAKRQPITDFDIVHEKLMHLFIVRSDLKQFAHEHPVYDSKGVFRLQYAFPTGGEYYLFADVAPKNAGSHIVGAVLNVSGSKEIASAQPPSSKNADLKFTWGETSSLPPKKTFILALTVTDAKHQPVTDLQPYLGALAHLVLVHEDGITFVHSHADELDAHNGKDGTIRFLTRLPKEGNYRGWAQISRHGEVVTTSTTLSTGPVH